jgi:hypothetical protein
MMSDRQRREAIGRMLHLISVAASFYALQAKNERNEMWVKALPEMQDLLLRYESLLDVKD